MHRIRAITLDLDNTLWPIDPVIRRAEATLWEWLTDNYPRIPAEYSAEDMLEVREIAMEEHWEKRHDFRFLRKLVLEKVAVDCGYSADLVEPAFAVFDRARNEVDFYPDGLLFQKSVELEMNYQLADLRDVNESNIKLFYYNENDKIWQHIGGETNVTDKTFKVNISHFSRYALAHSQ